MALKIFDVDPAASPKRSSDDLVARFRSGAQVQGNPVALTEWRITTGDPDVADTLAEALGGSVAEWETQTDEKLEVYTEANSIEILLDGPGAVRSGMVLWGKKGKIRDCDGVTQGDGQACACPSTIKERKEASKLGSGCDPSLQVYFKLAAFPELGKMRFLSGSWTFAGEIGTAEEALAKIDGPARATLHLEAVEFTNKQGKDISFTKPVLTITGPADDADFSDDGPFG